MVINILKLIISVILFFFAGYGVRSYSATTQSVTDTIPAKNITLPQEQTFIVHIDVQECSNVNYDIAKDDTIKIMPAQNEPIIIRQLKPFDWLQLITPIITVISGVLVYYWRKHVDRKAVEKQSLYVFDKESQDIYRHITRNIDVLNAIIESIKDNTIPSIMHFEKLKINESSFIFSQDFLSQISYDKIDILERLRVQLRNRNIESENTIKYIKSGRYSYYTLKEYLKYSLETNKKQLEDIVTLRTMLSLDNIKVYVYDKSELVCNKSTNELKNIFD
jgi:hypothetical protein